LRYYTASRVSVLLGQVQNAMAFASGRVSSGHMLLAGGAISLIGVALLLAGYPLVLPMVF
jgi:di/tricarboxylate transporter